MDSARFGRALGFGARMAAKTVKSAVDAAAAPAPSGGRPSAGVRGDGEGDRPAAQRTEAARGRGASRKIQDLRKGGRRFGEAALGPVVRLSGVLWLEVTGVFFGLFAVSAGVGAWKLRGAWRGSASDGEARSHLLVAIVICVLFGYFCMTSFVRARRRERRR